MKQRTTEEREASFNAGQNDGFARRRRQTCFESWMSRNAYNKGYEYGMRVSRDGKWIGRAERRQVRTFSKRTLRSFLNHLLQPSKLLALFGITETR